MRIKMVDYYVPAHSASQIFATFEYQRLRFDMVRNTQKKQSYWKFKENEAFEQLKKITNVELVERNCSPYLSWIDKLF